MEDVASRHHNLSVNLEARNQCIVDHCLSCAQTRLVQPRLAVNVMSGRPPYAHAGMLKCKEHSPAKLPTKVTLFNVTVVAMCIHLPHRP